MRTIDYLEREFAAMRWHLALLPIVIHTVSHADEIAAHGRRGRPT